jgi:endonuclease/exonuclease/phosphatase family metal-dependent hydrolase
MAAAAVEQRACAGGAIAVTDDHGLCIATYNIHKGVGTDRHRDLARTAAVIAEIGADILALQEADTRFGTRTGLLNLDHLRDAHGLIPVQVEGSGPAHGWHGNLVLIRDAQVEEVHKINLPGLEPRGALIADVAVRGRPLRVVATHLGLLSSSRAAQARVLIDRLHALNARPTVLLGDTNEWRIFGPSLWALERLFSRSLPARSFPARYPVLPLDRIMAAPGLDLTPISAHDTPLARRASDHLPVKARLRFPEG